MQAVAFLLLLLTSAVACAQAPDTRTLRAGDTRLEVRVFGVDDPARVGVLQDWIAEAARAPLTVAGHFPLRSARVEIRQRDSRDASPVPWGQTTRSDDVRVLLYVRADATPTELRDDWTAVHELSHLFHPYLGNQGRWLAEGLASYYQNILRARTGLTTPEDAWRKLDAGFERGRRAAAGTPLDALGRGDGGTMRIYWGGAAFWLEADVALRQRGRSLDAVLATYSNCCLRGTEHVMPANFVAALDRVGGDGVFADLYARYAASTSFPSLDDAYRALGVTRHGAKMRFSLGDAAARLRDAITTASATPVLDVDAGADSHD